MIWDFEFAGLVYGRNNQNIHTLYLILTYGVGRTRVSQVLFIMAMIWVHNCISFGSDCFSRASA